MKHDDINPVHAAYRDYLAADESWSAELRKAFGKDACNRRYDRDNASHPQACRDAYELYRTTGDVWRALVDASRNASMAEHIEACASRC